MTKPIHPEFERGYHRGVAAERDRWAKRLGTLMGKLDVMMVEARKPVWEFACSDDVGTYVHEQGEPIENACLVNTHLDAQLSNIQVLVGRLIDAAESVSVAGNAQREGLGQ